MIKQSKWVYIFGSIVIGIITIIAVVAGLMLSGVIDAGSYKLVFTSESKEIVYDGSELTCNEWTLESGELKDGHTATVTVTGKQKNVGTVTNSFVVAIYDENGADVTADYDITTIPGTLTMLPRPITLQSGSLVEEYNGTERFNESYKTVAGELISGHELDCFGYNKREDAGESENTFVALIKDAEGNDVTKNYQISYIYGSLEIKPMKVTISSGDRQKVYDGLPLEVEENDWSFSSEKKPLERHSVSVKIEGSQKDVGESEKKLASVVVKDGDRDVTFNYEFAFNGGKLIVEKKKIVISSLGDSKIEDGLPLEKDGFEITDGELIEGDEVTNVDVTGSQTEVGESPNTVNKDTIKIEDGNGNDVTDNYEIIVKEGTLSVISPDQSLQQSPSDQDLDRTVAYVTAEHDGVLYLRRQSFGDYTGSINFAPATEYSGLLDNTYSMDYLVGAGLLNRNVSSYKVRIEPLYQEVGYVLPYYQSLIQTDIYQIQTSDVKNSGNLIPAYFPSYYNVDYTYLKKGYLADYADEETEYGQWVRSNYLSLPSATKEVVDAVISTQGWNIYDNYIIDKIVNYTRSVAEYDIELNKYQEINKESDIVIALLQGKYDYAICSHFASVGVALFRAIGIPARYTVGYSVQVKANEKTDVKVLNGHAWVEIYLDGIGWVHVECTPGGANGDVSPDATPGNGGSSVSGKYKMQVMPKEDVVAYKVGYTHDPKDEVKIMMTLGGSSWDAMEKLGFTYGDVKVEGSRSEPGCGETTVTSFKIYDVNGVDVTDSMFEITYKPGTIKVYMYEITVKTESAKRAYNGQVLSALGYSIEGSYPPAFVFDLQCTGSRVVVGKSANDFAIKIYDEDGKEITEFFKINAIYGMLEVTQRDVEIVTGSAEKVYDGTELTCNTFTHGELVEGHTVEVEIIGSQTNIGRSANEVESVNIYDEDGKDVTNQYHISCILGVLKVSRP